MFLPPSRPRRPVRGMSLIEVLISIAIMAGIILAMLGLVPYGFDELQVNSARVQAVAVAQQDLDALRNWKQSSNPQPTATTVPIDQGDSYMNGAANPAAGVFTVSPNTCPVISAGNQINQYDCSVTVTWTQNDQSDSVTVESYVTAP
jgi:uncharacterized protein (TIGR02598 family)